MFKRGRRAREKERKWVEVEKGRVTRVYYKILVLSCKLVISFKPICVFISIDGLPEEISQLKKLETLILSNNVLSTFPDSFVNLKTLQTVNVSHNNLTEFPICFCQLIRVDFVDLSDNKITSIPNGIDVISAVEINLNRNQISIIPESVSKCRRLKVLRLEENCIELMGVPPPVLKDSSISLLCLEGNPVTMRELQEIPEYEKVGDYLTYMYMYSTLCH